MNAADLYPAGIWEEDGRAYTFEHLTELREFYAHAAPWVDSQTWYITATTEICPPSPETARPMKNPAESRRCTQRGDVDQQVAHEDRR